MAATSLLPRALAVAGAASLTTLVLPVATPAPAGAVAPPGSTVFISEIHYDNDGTDAGEAIEVFGPAGTDLSAWSIVLYNGNGGTSYDTDELTGLIPDEGDGYGTAVVTYPANGIQNGAPDAVALVNGTTVEQLLSYEGTFTAVGGPAAGLLSTDIGVSETGSEPVGGSVALAGTGTTYGELAWTTQATHSFGSLGPITPTTPPIPPVFISELHYDNAGTDAGEAVEVTGPAGVDLTGWSIVLYNGNGGTAYDTIALAGMLPDEGAGLGAAAFARAGIQNGAPDGLALVEPGGTLVEFLSYEGAFTGVGGAADGVASTDIGVAEPDSTPVGQSLQFLNGAWTGPVASSFGLVNFVPRNCPLPAETTPIHVAQGAGAATPCPGEDVTVEGTVVADFEGPSPALRGFYVQEEDADADTDPATSEALFVFNASNDSVAVGDLVRITGVVAEFQGQTQLNFPDSLTIVSPANPLPAASDVTMPFTAADQLEAVEGMLVTFPQTLYVTEFFQLGRFGEVLVSSGDRLAQPTANVAPGPPAQAMQAANDLNQLIIDDTLNNQNPDPIIYGGNGLPLTAANPLSGGDTVTDATGVMTFTWAGNSASGNAYRLRPATGPIEFVAVNPRPVAPPDVGGSLTIASFNVLNYFLTLDDGGNDCGPTGFRVECRGAETAEEYQRQHVKLMVALDKLDADVLGLIELENSEGVEPLVAIVDGLNALNGPGTYAYVDTGNVGTDTIKVGIIYKPATVSPLRAHAVLDSTVDPRFNDDLQRPSLAQSFVENATGEVMTLVVNHLKSKNCGGETGGDIDNGDGQACFNATRTAAAEALVDWVATHPTDVDDDDFLVMGDLNSYAKEDPITVLTNAGFVDLAAELDDDPYSFVFDGQWGYLDYALASPSLADQVTGAAEYHINADEVPVLDYNTNFKSPGQVVSLFAPDEFRTSDHDPVVVGLGLDAGIDAVVVPIPPLLWPPNHTLRNVTLVAIDRSRQRVRLEILRVTSSEADSGLGQGDLPGDIVPVDHDTVRLRAEAFSRFGRTYAIDLVLESGGQSLVDDARVFVLPRF